MRGPRQVGKTTAQLQIIEDLLGEGTQPNTILRVQFDELGSLHDLVDPILRIADWFQHHIAGTHFNRLARAGQWAHLFFDEVQSTCRVPARWRRAELPVIMGPQAVPGRPRATRMLAAGTGPAVTGCPCAAPGADHTSRASRRKRLGSAASTIAGLDVTHWPARGADREVDFVLTVGIRRVQVEIKYQRRIDPYRDTFGLRSFIEKTVNNASFGILITQDASGVVDDPRIVTLPLSTFLLLR